MSQDNLDQTATDNENLDNVDNPDTGAQATGEDTTNDHNSNNENGSDDKSAKIIDKLKKRIGAEQGQKNDYKDQLDKTNSQLEKALEQIERLKKGEDPNKEPEADERDKEISALKAQIKRADITKQARAVLTEGGINVPEDVLGFVVTDDDQKTLDNVKSLIGYTQSIQSAVREEFRKGTTPRAPGKPVGSSDLAQALGITTKKS